MLKPLDRIKQSRNYNDAAMNTAKVYLLRVTHGLFALYFLFCLGYLYYAAVDAHFDLLLLVAVVSLGVEGFVVFILNNGDCPLIHIQQKIGDERPFFELFLKPHRAKKAIPAFAAFTWLAVGLLLIRVAMRLKFGQ